MATLTQGVLLLMQSEKEFEMPQPTIVQVLNVAYVSEGTAHPYWRLTLSDGKYRTSAVIMQSRIDIGNKLRPKDVIRIEKFQLVASTAPERDVYFMKPNQIAVVARDQDVIGKLIELAFVFPLDTGILKVSTLSLWAKPRNFSCVYSVLFAPVSFPLDFCYFTRRYYSRIFQLAHDGKFNEIQLPIYLQIFDGTKVGEQYHITISDGRYKMVALLSQELTKMLEPSTEENDAKVLSEKDTVEVSKWHEVLKDGKKVLCIDELTVMCGRTRIIGFPNWLDNDEIVIPETPDATGKIIT